MNKEKITLTKGELNHIIAQAAGYAWNEANRNKEGLKYPMEAYDNVQKEKDNLTEYYWNKLNQNKDE